MHFFQLHQYSFSCSLINFFSPFHFQFFSTISKRLHMKDSMTLSALVRNIQKAHTPAPDVRVIGFIFDIKGWIEPLLNKIKNHVYPHTYRFFKSERNIKTGQVMRRGFRRVLVNACWAVHHGESLPSQAWYKEVVANQRPGGVREKLQTLGTQRQAMVVLFYPRWKSIPCEMGSCFCQISQWG